MGAAKDEGGQVRGRCRGRKEGIFTAFDWFQALVLKVHT